MEPMTIPECFYRVSAKGLILDETRSKFLLCLEENGYWELPGGGIDFGESPQEALRREVLEEMGLEVTFVSENPKYFLIVKGVQANVWLANAVYEMTVRDLNVVPSAACVEARFFSAEEASVVNLEANGKAFINMFNPLNHK